MVYRDAVRHERVASGEGVQKTSLEMVDTEGGEGNMEKKKHFWLNT